MGGHPDRPCPHVRGHPGAIAFLRWTAARRSEAIKLRWEDLDYSKQRPEATFRDTKNPKGGKPIHRTIFLTPEAVAVLDTLTKELHAAKLRKDRIPPSPRTRPPCAPAPVLSSAWTRARPRLPRTRSPRPGDAPANKRGDRRHPARPAPHPHHRAGQLAPCTKSCNSRGTRPQMLTRYYNPDMQDLGELFEVTKAAAEKAQRDYLKKTRKKNGS